MQIDHLYRYPVKGLTAEALEAVDLSPGQALPWDRAFALAQGDAPFDPAQPAWLPKHHFMCLMRNARIATLRSTFDERSGVMTLIAPDGAMLQAHALSPAGRAQIAAWLTAFLGDEARGTPVLHHTPGHVFGDMRGQVISLINQASLHALEAAVGARLRVTRRIPRCKATEVNPITADRDADPVEELRAAFGHVDLGVYAEVLEGGRIAMGDAIELV